MLTTIEPRLREATLVRAAQNGDRVAFGSLYEHYERLIHGIMLAPILFT